MTVGGNPLNSRTGTPALVHGLLVHGLGDSYKGFGTLVFPRASNHHGSQEQEKAKGEGCSCSRLNNRRGVSSILIDAHLIGQRHFGAT